MSVTRMSLNRNFKYDFREDNQILNYKRIIYINDVRSDRLPFNPLEDIFYRLFGGQDVPTLNGEMCEVTVVNLSAVKGSIHSSSGSLIKQNNYIYHGIIREPFEQIGPNSVVEFEHNEYSVLVDEKCTGTPGDNGYCETYTSDDSPVYGGLYVCGRQAIVPDPLHYDEIDQVRDTGDDETSYDMCLDDLRSGSSEQVFSTTLSNLIDDKTVVYRRTLTVDETDYSGFKSYDNRYDGFTMSDVIDVVTDIQMSMDKNCINSIKAVLGGELGFNIGSYTQLFTVSESYRKISLMCMLDQLRAINTTIIGMGVLLFINVSDATSVNVKIVDKKSKKIEHISSDLINVNHNVMRPVIDNYKMWAILES